MKKQSGLTKAIVVLLLFMLGQHARANRNFVPDWTFHGSSISHFRTLGDVDWRAENGEIIGVTNWKRLHSRDRTWRSGGRGERETRLN